MPARTGRRIVEFVDTSILLEILDVPGKAQHRAEVIAGLRERVDHRRQLILPTAAVIETGNHIHHLADGKARRRCAVDFAGVLDDSARGAAPWVLHDATWDAAVLDAIRGGCSTGVDLIEHATRGRQGGLGAGDLSVLAERDLYRDRRVDRKSLDVRVWTTDAALAAYS